jgi:hypothetical protein
MIRRFVLVVAVMGALALAAAWSVAPPAARRLRVPADSRILRGALHVHTVRSDGAGTPDDVAHGAQRAGLQFVVLTDHGDGTRRPDPPHIVDGVLVLDAVEISTSGGHYLALGLGQAPYRLAGEARDVVEDVHRLGGFGIVAHPDSPKPELRWREWQAPFDGIEWLNADSAWRDEPRSTLVRALAAYWLRPGEVIASLFDRPSVALARWDALARRRPVVGVAGQDAHARMGLGGNWEPGSGDRSVRLPSYEAAFRSFSIAVRLTEPWVGAARPTEAAAQVLSAVRAGHVFTVIDGLAGPATLDFVAQWAGGVARMGDRIPAGDAALRAEVMPVVPDAELRVLRDGVVVARAPGGVVQFAHTASDAPASYRVEVGLPGAPGTPPVPWIVTNPIAIGVPALPVDRPLRPAPTRALPLVEGNWTIEKHAGSTAALEASLLAPDNRAWTFSWQLGEGRRAGQYVAMRAPVPVGGLTHFDRVTFTIRSPTPTRVSVQLRAPTASGARWQRSIYAGPEARTVTVVFADMSAIEAPPGTPVPLDRVDSLLFVIDTVNTLPGTAGETWVSRVRFEG